MSTRRNTFGGIALSIAVIITAAGCGSDADTSDAPATLCTSPTAAANEGLFGAPLADPIDTWRTSFTTGSMTLAIPGTVVGPSLAGRPVDLAASGESVLGSQPTDVDEAYHIGSMTKLFTAELIMQLDQEGLLSLVGRRNGQHGKGSGELAPCPGGRRLTARPGARAVPFQDQRAVTGRPALV